MCKKFIFCFVLPTVLLTGCSSGQTSPHAKTGTQNSGELGDLSEFKKIAEDTLVIVEKKDMAGAKTRIKDLETAWDNAEPTLKPKSETAWTSIDKAIDHALAAVRKDNPVPEDCSMQLKAVIVKLSAKDQKLNETTAQ